MARTEGISAGQAHTRYRLADGTLVPGVTTVLSALAKPALVPWANQLGLKGIDVRGYVDGLARIGTLAHRMIEHDLGAPEPDYSTWSAEERDRAENAFLKYLEWRSAHEVVPLLIEAPLVSERFRYGGTLDCLAVIDGVPTVLDVKTARAIYPEHLHQVAAYWRLAEEHGHEVQAVRILQVGRTADEGFGERVVPVAALEPHWRVFRACLDIYAAQAELRASGGI